MDNLEDDWIVKLRHWSGIDSIEYYEKYWYILNEVAEIMASLEN